MWNSFQVNATEYLWWWVNNDSVNELLPSSTNPLPEPMLTQIYVTICSYGLTRPQQVNFLQSMPNKAIKICLCCRVHQFNDPRRMCKHFCVIFKPVLIIFIYSISVKLLSGECHRIKWWQANIGSYRSLVNSPRNGQWCRALMFTLICAWTNGWVNTGDASDLRRHHTHYDATVMFFDELQRLDYTTGY